MPALVLQRLDRFDARTNNVTVPNLESKFAVIQWLLFDRTDTFLEHPHLLSSVQVIEDDPFVTLDDYNFPRFVGVRPANVDVGQNVVGIPKRDETNVVPAVTQDLASHRADPLRSAVKEIVNDGDVVGSKVPKGIHVAADGAEICSTGVEIIDATTVVLNILLDLPDARIE